MTDKYYVYRPMIDLIGISEGTAQHRGYNETLGYGAYTGGDVVLTKMTLDAVDALQTRMLKHPKNKLRSSAVGWSQIIRTTMREIRKALGLTGKELFNEDMQDRMTCYLLGVRGIDKWLAGRLSTDTLINNLAKEWASFPKTDGKGAYEGQQGKTTVADVMSALNEVKKRHMQGQPVVEVAVPTPVVPVAIDKEVKQKTNRITSLFGAGGFFTVVSTWLNGADKETIMLVVGGVIVVCVLMLIGGEWIVRRIRSIRAAVETL